MRLFDAHAHLQDERLRPILSEALSGARQIGVQKISSCGSSESDWEAVQKLAREFPELIIPSYGLHPWYVGERSSDWLDRLREFLREDACSVGEIGLDFALDKSTFAEQEKVFLEQFSLARQLGKGVSIHCRKAWGRFVELVEAIPDLPPLMVHSYSGSPDVARELSKRGVWLSFSGTITRSGNTRAHRSAQAIPENLLLIETDAPDLPPAIPPYTTPGDKTPNLPKNLLYPLKKIAELRRVSPEALSEIVFANACRLFRVTT